MNEKKISEINELEKIAEEKRRNFQAVGSMVIPERLDNAYRLFNLYAEAQAAACDAERALRKAQEKQTMDAAGAINAVRQGTPIDCTQQEYREIRTALQHQADKWIDQKQDLYAMLALNEVKRLDFVHHKVRSLL